MCRQNIPFPIECAIFIELMVDECRRYYIEPNCQQSLNLETAAIIAQSLSSLFWLLGAGNTEISREKNKENIFFVPNPWTEMDRCQVGRGKLPVHVMLHAVVADPYNII